VGVNFIFDSSTQLRDDIVKVIVGGAVLRSFLRTKKRLAGGSRDEHGGFRCADGKVIADRETRIRIVEIRQAARETGIVRNPVRL